MAKPALKPETQAALDTLAACFWRMARQMTEEAELEGEAKPPLKRVPLRRVEPKISIAPSQTGNRDVAQLSRLAFPID